MSITNTLTELEGISVDISKKQKSLKFLQKKKKELEKEIMTYLQAKEKQAITLNNKTWCINKKETRLRVKKKDKIDSIKSLFQNNGIRVTEDFLTELDKLSRGNIIHQQKLIIKPIH